MLYPTRGAQSVFSIKDRSQDRIRGVFYPRFSPFMSQDALLG